MLSFQNPLLRPGTVALCIVSLVLVFNFCVPAVPAQDTSNLAVTVAKIDRARILKLANAALKLKPPAITDHFSTNSAGGPHDFFSQADYAWPNPATPNGLPFVGRDGESNPNVFSYHRMAMRDMKDAVAALAAAYLLTGDDKYPRKAAKFIKVFFLDEKTRMNPNLQYAQAVLGAHTGNA